MKILDQIRAAAALRTLERNPEIQRSDVSGIPALILTNGLLAAAAYCCEPGKDSRAAMKACFNGIAEHLNGQKLTGASTGESLIADLASKDNLALQRATTETLAVLAYLKRFAQPKKDTP
jgi:CRISPR/Cas system CMR-associated protein Cmr5 small subunit